MNYYKDKITGQVYAYDDGQLSVVARMNELEKLIQTKEPYYIEARNNLHQSTVELERLKLQLDNAIESEANEDIISVLTIEVDEATEAHNQAMAIYVPVDAEYQSLKTEYDAILPVFFEVRENISVMKKMSAKEVDAYLNPPISKEQLITEAEIQKQSLLAEANNAIAPLQDAVDLDMATDEELSALQKWKKYRVLLNRVDTLLAPNIVWPEKP